MDKVSKDKLPSEILAIYRNDKKAFDCYAHKDFMCELCFNSHERDYYYSILEELYNERANITFCSFG